MTDAPPSAADEAAPGPRNRLDQETSPYLLQHKDNPVHWWAWGPEALAQAQRTNKPILLSVGYAACHWCHVMAHESFENPAIAQRMNTLFVNIKVDREERPDLDMIYQRALALLGQQGGWPLTMFLKPTGEPYWGGTYFPPSGRYGRPGFPQVLESMAGIYAQEPDKVDGNATAILDKLDQLFQPQPGTLEALGPDLLDRAGTAFTRQIDPFFGGITGAPKFPQVPLFRRIFLSWRRTGSAPMKAALHRTLVGICQGGIYDHLGGGFARYSVDDEWLVPHFEKMLYDNASLMELLSEVWCIDGRPLYAQRVAETVDWLQREMMADNGAFASALDADSEGEEGKAYVWTLAEIQGLLDADDARLFADTYEVTRLGNWEGVTVLNRRLDPDLKDPQTESRLAQMRETLLAVRAKRIQPQRDDKVLADWNGLMLSALVIAAESFERPAWLALARQVFDVLVRDLSQDGSEGRRLYHSWCAGRAAHPATLEDYANLSRAALLLHQATADPRYLSHARAWVETLDAGFWDTAVGGYFLTDATTADVIRRPRDIRDDATPNGNATMVEVLHRLWAVTGEAAYRARRDQLVAAFAGEAARNVMGLGTYLNALEMVQRDATLVLVGAEGAVPALLEHAPGRETAAGKAEGKAEGMGEASRAAWRQAVRLAPHGLVCLSVGPGAAVPEGHPAHGKAHVAAPTTSAGDPTPPDGESGLTAYLCAGGTCSLPITTPQALTEALQALLTGASSTDAE